jgi:hypothetical protein
VLKAQAVMQRRLISLHGQHVVGATVDNFACDLRLTPHRIDRYHCAQDFEHFQQLWDRGDLVALFNDDDLAQGDVVGRCPSTDHMDRRLAASRIVTATECLAIDGDNLSVRHFMQCGDPT